MFNFKLENENGNVVDLNDGMNYIIIPPVSGLNPPDATLFSAKSPNQKGSRYNGSTLNERTLILTVKFLGEIERNRNALYEWVDSEQYVKVYYRNGLKNVYCEGYVRSCPTDLFSQNEIVTISIVCGNPYWHDLNVIETDISTLLKQFTFPFAIDSNGIPFSTLREVNTTNVYNSGAETGAKFVIRCLAELKNFTLYDANDTTRIFRVNYTFPEGWLVEIDTEASPKTCKAIKPNGETINIMRYIGKNPTWFTLRKGHNLFGFSAESGSEAAEITVSHTSKYLGV